MDAKEADLDGRPGIRLTGELNIQSAPDIRKLLLKYVKGGSAGLILDLGGLEFMDTSGLATLIEAHLTMERHGGKMVLFGLRPRIAEVFQVTQVWKLFHVCQTQEEAVEATGRASAH